MTSFICYMCGSPFPSQFQALTYARNSLICRWCATMDEKPPKPVMVYEPDLKALTLAEVTGMVHSGLDVIRKRKKKWWCW